LLFSFFYKKKIDDRISTIQSLAQPGFLTEIFHDISHYRGIYCKDHRVNARLIKHSSRDDIILCELTYSYHKSQINKVISAVIYRAHNSKDLDDCPLLSEICLENEFVWYNLEEDMGIKIEDEEYKAGSLIIGNEKKDFKREISIDKKTITFSCALDKDPDPDSFITYKITIPLEAESAITITAEFPSNHGEVNFDYTSMKDNISVCTFPKAGLRQNPVAIYDEGVIRCRHDGWLLPKDGYTFAWWKKTK